MVDLGGYGSNVVTNHKHSEVDLDSQFKLDLNPKIIQ